MPKPTDTVATYAAHWLATVSAPPYVTPYTTKVRRQFAELYLLPKLGERLVAEVGTPDLVALQGELFARQLATSTVRHVFGNLVAPMLRQAKREGVITTLPDLDLQWPKPDDAKPDAFTVAERDAILADYAGRGAAWHSMSALVLLAGLRPSEAAAVSWDKLDLESGELRIDRSLVDGNFGPTKTRKATRTIVVGDRLRGILREVRPARPARGDLLITNQNGALVDANRWSNRIFRPTLARLGIRPRGLYCGRHTFISIAVSVKNANIAKVAAYCGTSVVMIERHYLRHLVALTDPTGGAVPIS
jgi:integrase